ncbi:hypothetical protein O0L34_g5073 [Tuta absoluta]|nr:hypothetical protein O0L34_g5073 [Tuta absoluta]
MHWIKHEDMLPPSDDLKSILRGKIKAASWIVSNCFAISNRQDFVDKLNKELESKYKLNVDIYGRCGNMMCDDDKCNDMIKKDYFFYLSFENSFSEDYVTEKLTRALENNAVPIVFGGANYSRFMPDGAYLNARELGVEKLAAKMNELMNDFDQYADYFRWTNHYLYHRRDAKVDTNDYCAMCTILNNESKVKQKSVYENFKKWWNNPNACR